MPEDKTKHTSAADAMARRGVFREPVVMPVIPMCGGRGAMGAAIWHMRLPHEKMPSEQLGKPPCVLL